MKIIQMAELLNAKTLIAGPHIDDDISSAFCSDLMSDVLAFVNESTVLITGLTNPHVVRTSEMLDLKCIIFVRGKIPSEEIIEEAEELGITVLSTDMTAFTTCGILYGAGLKGLTIKRNEQGGIV